jgi:uncharacterized membrane protein YphA (DoxX/SURF4 family)
MKTQAKIRQFLVDLILFLFILLFVYAASNKLMDFENFEIQLGKSPVLSDFAHFVAWSIPTTELSIAILLIFKNSQLIALYASFSLMVMFSAYIVVILNFSEYIPCSCGGILEHMTWTQHLWFNMSFVVFGIMAVLFYPNTQKEIIAQ